LTAPGRTTSYGQDRDPSAVDRFGVWLSARAVRRHATLDGARVADIGCGYHARFARSVADRAASVILVDVALDPALEREPKVTAVEATVEEALGGLPAGSFDLVLCLSVLEHLWRPQEALGGMHRLLAPGGKLLVNVPSWRGKRFLEFSAFRLGTSPANEMDDHKRYYDPKDLWPMLVAAGFSPSRIRCHRHKFGLNTFAVCAADGKEDPG
jgi:SAM-dependent methyltransferase